MNKKTIFICAAFFTLILISCGKTTCNNSVGLRFAFIHFTTAETDTLMLKKYPKGGNFTTVIDSVLIDSLLLKFVNRNDTLFPSALHIKTLLLSQYDYKLFIPATGKTYSITNIQEEATRMKKPLFGAEPECVNPITAYTIDGQTTPVPLHHEIVYLKK